MSACTRKDQPIDSILIWRDTPPASDLVAHPTLDDLLATTNAIGVIKDLPADLAKLHSLEKSLAAAANQELKAREAHAQAEQARVAALVAMEACDKELRVKYEDVLPSRNYADPDAVEKALADIVMQQQRIIDSIHAVTPKAAADDGTIKIADHFIVVRRPNGALSLAISPYLVGMGFGKARECYTMGLDELCRHHSEKFINEYCPDDWTREIAGSGGRDMDVGFMLAVMNQVYDTTRIVFHSVPQNYEEVFSVRIFLEQRIVKLTNYAKDSYYTYTLKETKYGLLCYCHNSGGVAMKKATNEFDVIIPVWIHSSYVKKI